MHRRRHLEQSNREAAKKTVAEEIAVLGRILTGK
jgi:hypothetical protein